VGTGRDLVLFGNLQSLFHRGGVTGVPPAGNIGGCDVTHEFSIAAVGQPLTGLAHIGIDVDGQ
jgi:hypothetical protein